MATTPSDMFIVGEARQLYRSVLMDSIRAAHKSAHPATVRIGKYTVQYEAPAFSGFTSFGITGFVIGREALYRLHPSEMTKGGSVDKHLPMAETQAAFQFAKRFYTMI